MTITKNKKRFSEKPDRAISTSRDFTPIYNERGNAQEHNKLVKNRISKCLFFIMTLFNSLKMN